MRKALPSTGLLAFLISAFPALVTLAAPEPRSASGIYPHLAMFNEEDECGIGAVVPWADRLWVVTYAPHKPTGSTDKLYEIAPDLTVVVRPESIGGTPANRMIHRESRQLFIGPYVIDHTGRVRVIPYSAMFGRPTGNARHLVDPTNKVYCATMEEGLYEIDVRTLAVTELWADEQRTQGRHAQLPGYHGKGLYSAQGRIVYANNGEHGPDARRRPETPSGVLAEWDGRSDRWTVVRRSQFTEVTGPGGLAGPDDPATEPIWTIGWDHRSLILMLLDRGRWHAFRLPKSSHSYDGAHGWNTEWPRIRDIGEPDLLMTMHGAFWRFPRTFSAGRTGGIAPRSNYLKVIGDFARWQDRLVFGCDDTARSEFLNRRRAKGRLAAPQSQSNLWFLDPARLDDLGPVLGRGGVWVADDAPAREPSEPFLVAGFSRRGLHLLHATTTPASIEVQVDRDGTGGWTAWRSISLPASSGRWIDLADLGPATWVRLVPDRDLRQATAWFELSNPDRRPTTADRMFDPLARIDSSTVTPGLLHPRAGDHRTLAVVDPDSRVPIAYELDGDLRLTPSKDPRLADFVRRDCPIPAGVVEADAASLWVVDDDGRRWRLPRGDPALDRESTRVPSRVCREVATERDLLNLGGTFFELPAENAGGFSKLRPVATHNRRIHDYCSFRGLLVMTGLQADAPAGAHLVRSDDGRAAVWIGAIDDVWRLGKVRGRGGPWQSTPVRAGTPSDPYLFAGYDRRHLTLSHDGPESVSIRVEVDITGSGGWTLYRDFEVPAGKEVEHTFPDAFGAYWLRTVASRDGRVTAQLRYD